ncbi:amidohydrolase [Pseudoteredinibacter isoporae]|uniref:Amidohydrolase 3 domain-containing protein n=1 Tax=Pseudoteredinibacter isoporae TaxID=570281 RepID=A0A7X0MVG9_9GAMM|nr:amidohydrolase [Pseudoteredinibacter isoporae]MBB6521373.1 hypothetical protein [Pseudoteredinibacter isoporae]NHO86928.1 amidohydrolase [Pseudoteredinibacter isoporae]NIB24619.1 amidohydrolase [Pseudoteredinibacter isoporae]
MKRYVYLLWLSFTGLLFSCSEAEHPSTNNGPGLAIYSNAKIYTANPEQPWAEAMVTKGEQIIFVGSNEQAQGKFSDQESLKFDLQGRLLMPGIIDSHTHPGLVSILSYDDTDGEPMPAGGKHDIVAWLNNYIRNNWWQYVVDSGEWDVKPFLPDGPHKADLDAVSSWRPIILFDSSGHSVWVNSAFLDLVGVDKHTENLSPVSYFVKDEHGELTGWVKEFALIPYIGDSMLPSEEELREKLRQFLNFLVEHGVTTLWDAGNLSFHNEVYSVLADLDKEGLLPLRYEASYHIYSEVQLANAVSELLELRRKYGSDKLRFNSIKIHYDGVLEVKTAALSKPYEDGSGDRGDVIFERDRLADFMAELEKEGIDLHIHAVGDRAVTVALDAKEAIEQKLGKPLDISVTLAHLEYVKPEDIPRFQSLEVTANFTPHWFSADDHVSAAEHNVGHERYQEHMATDYFVKAGANVTLSSDVISGGEVERANPFIGLEMSMTRKEYSDGLGSVKAPADSGLNLASAVDAYTINGAKQLNRDQELGSLRPGKLADFIVLGADIFTMKASDIHKVKPIATVISGELVYGALQ